MTDGLMDAASVLGGALAGMTCLSLAMARHHARIYGAPLRNGAVVLLRLIGAACLLVIGIPATHGWDPSIGFVVWTGSLCVAALVVTAWLTWWPRLVPLAGAASALAGLAGWMLGV